MLSFLCNLQDTLLPKLVVNIYIEIILSVSYVITIDEILGFKLEYYTK